MSTREEIEAAIERWGQHKKRVDDAQSPYYSGTFEQDEHRFALLARDMRLLADAFMSDRAERQRRIEAAAHKIRSRFSCAPHWQAIDEIRDIITRCLDGETT